ncbi:hypothetical protein AB0G35_23940 [Streptomyces sp. NPDC021749]|uniref:hypothetical protein n=1 Tax=Streptomyces sp. NPDC021749 TaxID=3154905 RepID=UPI0033D40717
MSAELPAAAAALDAAHVIAASSPYLAALILIGAIAAGIVGLRRRRQADAALAHRACVELVPTSTFNPGLEEVGRAAHHFARIHHAAGAPARGSAARLRYTVTDGQMRCYLEGPGEAAAVLRMPAYAEVEVRTPHASADIHPVHFSLAKEAQR